MSADLRFLLKLLGLSTGLAVGIKLMGPQLRLPSSSLVALIIVMVPVIGVGLWMLWQMQRPTA
ncbi:MAG: hypothetical protein AAF289_14670 [Cyanobacteria bacterium P01_A01_bin.135]